MSYTPTEWQPGDIVTSVKLNKIETELVTLDGDVDTLKSEIDDVTESENLVVGSIPNASMTSAGVIVTTGSESIYIAPVVKDETYTFIINNNGIWAFFEEYPEVGSTSYSGSYAGGGNHTVTAPITGYIAIKAKADYASVQVVKGTDIQSYFAPGTMSAVDAEARAEIDRLSSAAEDKQNIYFKLINNSYVVIATGAFADTGDFDRTDYIPVSEYDAITITGNTSASAYNCFYDENKNRLSAFIVAAGTTHIRVPIKAAYMALSNTHEAIRNYAIKCDSFSGVADDIKGIAVVNPYWFARYTGNLIDADPFALSGHYMRFDSIVIKTGRYDYYVATWDSLLTDYSASGVDPGGIYAPAESFDYTPNCARVNQYWQIVYNLKTGKFEFIPISSQPMASYEVLLFAVTPTQAPFGPVYDQFKVKRGIDCYWEDVMGKVETACPAGDNFLFSFATDCHYAIDDEKMYYNPTNEVIEAMDNSLCLDAIINGGDSIIYGCKDKTYAVMALSHVFSKLNPDKVVYCMGNHDWNGVSGSGIVQNESWNLSNEESNALLTRHNKGIVKPTGADVKYFYRDFEDKKIRVIVLNTSDIDVEFVSSEITIDPLLTYGVRQEQLTWLTGTALNVPSDDWHIIIVMHVGLYLSADGFPGNNALINKQSIINILSAFVNKTTYSYSETDTDHDGYFTVSGSGTFSGAHGTLVAVFSGHAHADGYCNKDGFNAIQTEASYCEPGTTPTREVRTTDEFAIDCVEINKTDKEITLTRFGYGSDRSYSYS